MQDAAVGGEAAADVRLGEVNTPQCDEAAIKRYRALNSEMSCE